MAADKQKNWEASMDKQKFKNEWQMDAEALGKEHQGLRIVMWKGLTFRSKKLESYNKKLVVDFYKKLKVPVGEWENNPNTAITSGVAGVDIVITSKAIARSLKFTRSTPESITYPIKGMQIV